MDLLCDRFREALGSFLEASFPSISKVPRAVRFVKRLMLLIGIDEGEDRLLDGK